VARAKIACTGAENQRYSRPSQSVIIAIFGTHNPLVVDLNYHDNESCGRSYAAKQPQPESQTAANRPDEQRTKPRDQKKKNKQSAPSDFAN
jgi:hypothetical protein